MSEQIEQVEKAGDDEQVVAVTPSGSIAHTFPAHMNEAQVTRQINSPHAASIGNTGPNSLSRPEGMTG